MKYPADLRDTEVVAVQVTGPHRVRVTHRDGTSATHIFRPGDFGSSDFAALDAPDVFATAAVIDGCLAWDLGDGLVYDVAPEGLWAHAMDWCPDGSHDLDREVEEVRVELSALRMVELLPRMRELEAAGWALRRMDKPVMEGNGQLVRATFVRGEVSGDEARIARTPGLTAQLDAANARPSSEFWPRLGGRPC